MQVLQKLTIFCGLGAGISSAFGQQAGIIPPARVPVTELVRSNDVLGRYYDPGESPEQRAAYRAWKRSIIPVVASQALDAASSYGMRELNPLLGDASGRFGPRAVGIKFGATLAILGVEYWIVKKHPGAARVLSKLNWSGAVVTTGFAAHNFAIR